MNIATLFARIGIKDEGSAKVEDFKRGLAGAAKSMLGLTLSIGAFETAIAKAVQESMKLAFNLRQFEAESGQSSQTLQEWTGVAAQMGIGADAISSSVQALAENREKIKLGQGNISGYQMLGINPMDDPFKVLAQLREKTAGMPAAMKKNMLASLGVSAQFMQMLDLTNDQFDRMKENAFVIPEGTLASIQKTQGNLNALGNMTKWFSAILTEKLGPEIDKITKAVIKWVKENKDGLIDGISKAFNWVMKFLGAVFNVSKIIGDAITHTIGWKNAVLIFLGVWAMFNAALLASPITWSIAGILALILVMDDLYHYQKGDKNSLFGAFAKASPEFKKILDNILGVINDLAKAMGGFLKGDESGFINLMNKWGAFGLIVTTIAGAFQQIFNVVSDLLKLDLSKLGKDLLHNDFWDKVHLDDKDIIGYFSGLFKQAPKTDLRVDVKVDRAGTVKTEIYQNGQKFMTQMDAAAYSDQSRAGRGY